MGQEPYKSARRVFWIMDTPALRKSKPVVLGWGDPL